MKINPHNNYEILLCVYVGKIFKNHSLLFFFPLIDVIQSFIFSINKKIIIHKNNINKEGKKEVILNNHPTPLL